MPQFKDKEEYEKWKAERSKSSKESHLTPQQTSESAVKEQELEKITKLKKLTEAAEKHLGEKEKIIASVIGVYETKILGKDAVREGVLLATNNRAVFFAKQMLGYNLEVFPYSNISSIERRKAFTGHRISLIVSGNNVVIKWINERDIKNLVNYIKKNIGEKTQVPSTNETTLDIPDQIKKLAELKNQGILNEEEFQEKKKTLLLKI